MCAFQQFLKFGSSLSTKYLSFTEVLSKPQMSPLAQNGQCCMISSMGSSKLNARRDSHPSALTLMAEGKAKASAEAATLKEGAGCPLTLTE